MPIKAMQEMLGWGDMLGAALGTSGQDLWPGGSQIRPFPGGSCPRMCRDVQDVPRLTPADEDVAPGVAPVAGEGEQQQRLQVQPLHQQPVEVGQH